MTHLLAYAAGFASGWVVRGTIDSSRGVVVGALSAVYGIVDRTKRFVAIEREQLEDLMAEARARYEARRIRSDRSHEGETNGKGHKEYVQ